MANAGFDVLISTSPPGTGNKSEMNEFFAGKPKKHLEQCTLCQEEDFRSDFDAKLSFDQHGDNLCPDPEISSLHVSEAKAVVGADRKSPILSIDNNHAGPFRVTLSVGGMTCASCSGTITKMVSDIQGVSEVAVSLLGKAATVIVDHEKLVDIVVETVEDCGFSVEVIDVVPLGALEEDSASGPRTVALRIDGMFCQ